MRLKLLALALTVSAGLCFGSASFAGGCKSCPHGSCTIQLPVEAVVAPPHIAKTPDTPPAAKTCPEIAKSAGKRPLRAITGGAARFVGKAVKGAGRGVGRLLFHRRGACR